MCVRTYACTCVRACVRGEVGARARVCVCMCVCVSETAHVCLKVGWGPMSDGELRSTFPPLSSQRFSCTSHAITIHSRNTTACFTLHRQILRV